MRNAMNKFSEWLDTKKISVIVILGFLASMIPIWYLAFFARPSGDDYGYSMDTHMAWENTHSLLEVLKAGLETTKSMCATWNGDYITVFLFTLMPEVFVPYSFWIVPISITIAVIGATVYLAYELLSVRLGFKWYESIMLASLILICSYQFIPSTAIGMYWYVGVMHYMFPHVLAMLLLGYLSKFERTGRMRYIIYSAIGGVLIGGSSYFSSFLVLLIFLAIVVICFRKNKKILWILLPVVTGLIALYFQITAPGNAARVGEGFGFSMGMVMNTILQSLWQGVAILGVWIKGKTLVFIALPLIAALVWECIVTSKRNVQFRFPLLVCGFLYGVYASMFAPAIYAAVDVSLGPETMQYFTFILVATAMIVYVEGWILNQLQKKRKCIWSLNKYRKCIVLPLIAICILLAIVFKGNIRKSVFVRSYEYVVSGQAADFSEQIASQMEILLDKSIKEAYLCPINDNQGPLMHMPVTENPGAFTNWAVAGFYDKDFVVMKAE